MSMQKTEDRAGVILANVGEKTSVFISYSRKDTAFVDRLATGLEVRGYDVNIDREDIEKGEAWWTRITDLITASDVVIFVMSLDSVASPVCDREIQHTLTLGKRIVPLLWREILGDIPQALSERNWVYAEACAQSSMEDQSAFGPMLDSLERAINLEDIVWVREHTKWISRATEWEAHDRPEGMVLRAAEITAAQTWASRRPATAPEIPSILSLFLDESLKKETKDRQRTRWLQMGIGALTVLAGLFVLLGGLSVTRVMAAFGVRNSDTLAKLAREANNGSDFKRAARYALAGINGFNTPLIGFTITAARSELEVALRADSLLRRSILMEGHEDSVAGAAFSSVGARVVTASYDKTARVWDAASGRQILVLQGHTSLVEWAKFSPDDSRIVTASMDRTARVWDANTGSQIAILEGHKDTVQTAVFSPDGTRIVTASQDNTARVWDAANGTQIALLQEHKQPVGNAVFSKDGACILTESNDKTARVWDADTGRQICILQGHAGMLHSAAFSPDGTRIVTASEDRTSRVWDANNGRQIAILKGHTDEVLTAVFSPDGMRIITASGGYSYIDGSAKDMSARVWDAATGQQIALLQGHIDGVISAEFSPDGLRILSASDDHTARVWDSANGREIAILGGHTNHLSSATFSQDGERVLTASDDKTARVWAWNESTERQEVRDLIKLTCETTLKEQQSILSDSELDRAPALDRKLDRDVCNPASPWIKLSAALGISSDNKGF